MSPRNITVKVANVEQLDYGYQMKVEVPELGMYMWGWRVLPSKREPGTWYAQQPHQRFGNKFKPTVEFDKQNEFWLYIERVCKAAAMREEARLKVGSDDIPF